VRLACRPMAWSPGSNSRTCRARGARQFRDLLREIARDLGCKDGKMTGMQRSVARAFVGASLLIDAATSDNSIARRHAAMTPFTPLILGTRDLYRSRKTQRNPPLMTTFMESVV
jgi:hypothetical protein